LSKQPDILILDEPTASITEQETITLFEIIRQLKSQGKSIVYISHRMKEIFRIADRVTVLKDGKHQGTILTPDITPQQLIQKMVGRELLEEKRKISPVHGEELLKVSNLTGKGFKNISFTLRKGEILGFAGLVGAVGAKLRRLFLAIRLVLQELSISKELKNPSIIRRMPSMPE
jgi:ribose transport system ATP-binding protein